MKKLLIVLCVLVLIAGVVLFWLRGNLDGLVQSAIANYGSAMTGATVKVAGVEIKTTDGKGTLRGLVVGNPSGFKTPHLLKADTIEVEVDLATLPKDVVVIKKIAVIAPDVIYEKGAGQTNIDALQKNIASYLGPSQSSGPGKKLIVNEFIVRGAKAQASAAFMGEKTVSVNLPDIHLVDLGKDKGGISPGELGQEITNAMEKRLMGSISFDKLMGTVGGIVGKAGTAIKGLFK